ncbi:hypothetical protein R1flu_029183 [Riccia fluitans]|uniref:Transglycosylase SLT domain-containing protein n=1 Tax=Riccia fluitans TaxID=41844 RepID=A0ABD1XNS9_9MARC
MGQCQFMPSSFQADAVEYDRDGRRGWISPEELWRSLLPGCLCYAVTHGQTVAGHFSEQQLVSWKLATTLFTLYALTWCKT